MTVSAEIGASPATDALNFRHSTPAFRTWAGPDALAALPKDLARVGATHAVVVCGPSMVREGAQLARLETVLAGRLVARFDRVQQHSPIPAVDELRYLLQDIRADAVVVLGGGSAVVTARAASILLAEDRDVRELCTRREPGGRMVSPKLTAPKLPQWIVPTTPTTAYAKAGAAVRDPATGERLALFDPKVRAQGVILDPDVGLTASVPLTLGAAMNAYAMCLEGLASSVDNPLAEALTAQALRMLTTTLPHLLERDNGDTRVRLMTAALLCGQGSDVYGGGMAQALAHAAGPRSTSPNGVIESLLLPAALDWHLAAAGASRLADALPRKEGLTTSAADIGGVITDMLDTLGLPTRLRDAGVPREALHEIAEQAVDDWALSTIERPINAAELSDLLARTW